MNIADYMESAILNHVFRNHAAGTECPRTSIYVGLVTSSATSTTLEEGDLANEIDAYVGDRPLVEFTAPVQVLGKATIKNIERIEYEGMPSCTVKFVILCDSPTKGDGNILWWMQLDENKVVNAGDICRIEAEELTVTLN